MDYDMYFLKLERELIMICHTEVYSPVAFADVKRCGESHAQSLVDVVFKDGKDLDDLIYALEMLRDSTDIDHIHLQGYGFTMRSPVGSGEIVFRKPGDNGGENYASAIITDEQ